MCYLSLLVLKGIDFTTGEVVFFIFSRGLKQMKGMDPMFAIFPSRPSASGYERPGSGRSATCSAQRRGVLWRGDLRGSGTTGEPREVVGLGLGWSRRNRYMASNPGCNPLAMVVSPL